MIKDDKDIEDQGSRNRGKISGEATKKLLMEQHGLTLVEATALMVVCADFVEVLILLLVTKHPQTWRKILNALAPTMQQLVEGLSVELDKLEEEFKQVGREQ